MPGRLMLNELDDLHRDFLDLGHSVEGTVAEAVRALREPLAEALAADSGYDSPRERADRIVERCQRILLLYQPVATDFKQVTAILRVVGAWAHVGDLALGIAERAADLASSLGSAPEELSQMGTSVVDMVHAAVDAYEDPNPVAVRRVGRTYAEVTDLAAALSGWLTGAMKSDPGAVEPGLGLFAVVQSFQRIAEYATDLAEEVVAMVGPDGGSRPDDRCPPLRGAARVRSEVFDSRASSVTVP